MLRLLLLVFLMAAISVIPFLIWGEQLEANLSQKGAAGFMRGFGDWAWLVGIGLIASDIALPVPASAVMAALGIIYGPVIGGVVAASGSMLAGLLGYGICRMISPRTAERLAGAKGFEQAHELFERWGGWLVAGSRWLPVLPETISFLAGLTGMSFRRYAVALACGAVPLGFVFATAGHLGADNVVLTLVVASVAPLALWLVLRPFLKPVNRRPRK
jgi:uncharacterized membrane protein YdjX (TVP38/TMEM64 family)